MFCPHCGTESTPGLNYCKRCGGSLVPLAQGAPQETQPAAVATRAAWAAGVTTAAVPIIGLGIVFPMMGELALRGVSSTAMAAIALFVVLTVLGCTWMMLRFWSLVFGVAGAGARKAPTALPGARAADARELGSAARFESLNPAHVHSVTEQTTRTLDRAERK